MILSKWYFLRVLRALRSYTADNEDAALLEALSSQSLLCIHFVLSVPFFFLSAHTQISLSIACYATEHTMYLFGSLVFAMHSQADPWPPFS